MPIFMPPNEYGYQVNILDPKILPLYQRFKKSKGIPPHFPCSDAERLEFEEYILNWYLKKYPEKTRLMLDSLKKDSGEIETK